MSVEVAKVDPVFEPVRGKIAGAIRDLGDSSGDAQVFVENLAHVCREKLGVTVRLGARVTALRANGHRIDAPSSKVMDVIAARWPMSLCTAS